MRVAFSGAHATGKSTLIAEVGRRLPDHRIVEEPYHALVAKGHVFADRPGVEDFELQLEAALAALDDPHPPRVLFDRCPADPLAYLAALAGSADGSLARWIPRVGEALAGLDLVVFVPVERPDRIEVPVDEGRRLRRRVDVILREMLVEDGWGLGIRAMEVRGDLDRRVRQVLARLDPDPSTE